MEKRAISISFILSLDVVSGEDLSVAFRAAQDSAMQGPTYNSREGLPNINEYSRANTMITGGAYGLVPDGAGGGPEDTVLPHGFGDAAVGDSSNKVGGPSTTTAKPAGWEGLMPSNWFEQGTWLDVGASTVQWAGIAYFAGQWIGPMLGMKKETTDALSAAMAAG